MNPKVSQIRWWLLSLIIAASQPLNCGGTMRTPDAIDRAQAACLVLTTATIEAGDCDDAPDLDHCPAYAMDVITCAAWLDAAEAQMRQAGAR